MDTRFSSAIHMLILISEAKTALTSEQIADSVGTNASYIRKISLSLKKAEIIESRQGISGFRLLVPPDELSLYRIYQAVSEADRVHVFDLHQNMNDQCVVGKHIKPVLNNVFRAISDNAERELKIRTLADCIREMKTTIADADPR